MLERFLQELKDINGSIDKSSQDSKHSEIVISSRSKVLKNGEYFEGVIVTCGTFLNVKCDLCPFTLQIKSKREEVYEDDTVIFKAVSEPNRSDSTKLFWQADDVHLKE